MIGSRALGLTAVLAFGACTAASNDEPLGRQREAIVGGTPSDAADDATVLLFRLDPSVPQRLGICTAALVAPRLVITARHCVATTDETVGCDSDGTPLFGAKIGSDDPAGNLYVFTGKDRPALIGASPPALDPTKWQPAGRGAEVIDDRSGTLCNHDLALILLEKPIANVLIAPLRLDGDVAVGEKLVTVGWGVTSTEDEPAQRQRRSGVTTKRVGPSNALPVLTKSEFLFDESICLGDSGGPVFAQSTKAIVGVVSRGGNGLDPSKGGASSTCVGADNIATKLSPFKELITDAFQRAGSSPVLEPKPEDKSCSVGPVGAARSSGPLPLAALLAIAFLRRQRRFSTDVIP